MSAIIRLSSKLPADEETNGLDSLRDQLVEDDSQVIVAMTWMKVAYTKKYPTGRAKVYRVTRISDRHIHLTPLDGSHTVSVHVSAWRSLTPVPVDDPRICGQSAG